jgi:transcriptional regulator with XRE-family HTH domain
MPKKIRYPEFARRLRQAMEDAQVRPLDLAQHLNADPATISRWRAGTLHPGRERLYGIAEYLNKPLDYFRVNEPAEAATVFDVDAEEEVDYRRVPVKRLLEEAVRRVADEG